MVQRRKENSYPCERGCVSAAGNVGKTACHTWNKRMASPLNAQSTNVSKHLPASLCQIKIRSYRIVRIYMFSMLSRDCWLVANLDMHWFKCKKTNKQTKKGLHFSGNISDYNETQLNILWP